MQSCRLLITGASGSGTTTLGRALADAWAIPHADVDDYYWVPSSPPYTRKRPVADRLSLMNALFLPRDAWVLSGSVMGWGDPLIEKFDAVVFLTLAPRTRMARLERRETTRYGVTIEPGGGNEAGHQEFLTWAAGYDDDDFSGRSRPRHERWLAALACPVLRLDSAKSVPQLLAAVTAWGDSESRD